jgi:hypothetical protein
MAVAGLAALVLILTDSFHNLLEGRNMKWKQGMFFCMALTVSFRALASGESSQDHAAAVLFKNFETVVHSTPALISKTRPESVASYERVAFNYMLAGLEALDKRALPAVLAHSEEILVGSKDFLPPDGLGMTRSTRCYVIVLRKTGSLDFSKYFKPTAASASSIWNWSAVLGEFGDSVKSDPLASTLFSTQIAHSYILICNSEDVLEQVSRGMVSVSDDAEVLRGIYRWEDVRTRAFWCYRHYTNSKPQFIDRMIFRGTNQIAEAKDDEAFFLFVDTKRKTGLFRISTRAANDHTARNINTFGKIPPLKPAGPMLWETEFPLEEVGPFPESAYTVLWLFGWGVFV